MKGYFAAVVRVISRAVPNKSVARMFITRHRAFVFIIASALLVVSTTALLATKHNATTDSASNGRAMLENEVDGKIVVPGVGASTQITNVIPRTGDPMQTHVTVNGKSVEVPENGSIHKTIQSENGNKTDISISVDGNSTNSSISSSTSSIQVTTPSGTYMQSSD